mmetsp:Transcript_109181/g.163311  ORF Transcript_109181/g.163311 Transcript_109181/m.163311 type:complete len:675 (+) Transcript_109181:181-2205(+)
MPGFSYRMPDETAGRHRRFNFRTQETHDTLEEDHSGEASEDGGHGHGRKGPQGWGRGIIMDFKSTIGTHWVKEMTNFNTKTIAVSFFLFIAVIAPSITFGAVYAKRTNNYIGAVELLLATAWCGIFYSLVSGMPMMINGGTGPVLTFQAVTFELAKSMDIPFLPFNAWVGIWVAVYMLLAGFFDMNRLIKYATRFTDEIFAFLIVSIFILDAIGNPTSKVGLFHYFNPDHPHNDKQEDVDSTYDYMTVALLSLILGFGTAFFAIGLRFIRYSSFCCNDKVRSLVTDFAITISVVLFTLLKHTIFDDIPSEELNVPDSFAPTFNCCTSDCSSYFPDDCPDQAEAFGRRSWFVDLFDLNGKSWAIFMAAGPAALAFILAFLDNGITWHIVNHPSNKIEHGDAYNYDTCISALMVAVNSLVGLPWLVASTVPCIMHVSAMSERTKEGVTTSLQESRLTGFFTHVLVLGTCFALDIIKLVPLPVLYGVFLFMGLVALPAQQFWQRILLFFQEPGMLPKTPYTQYLKLKRVHLFTMIQLVFFAMLYVVKNVKAIAIAFPVMILLCIPARIYLLPKIFNSDELTLLDGSPEGIEDWITKKRAEDGVVNVDADGATTGEMKKLVDVEDEYGSTQKRRREKQVSIDKSIDEFMERHGLSVPDVPDVIDDDDDGNDDQSEISA